MQWPAGISEFVTTNPAIQPGYDVMQAAILGQAAITFQPSTTT